MALEDKIDNQVMKFITPPTFRFPKTRLMYQTTRHESTTASIPSTQATISPTTTITSKLPDFSTPMPIPSDDILQAVESSLNETMVSFNETTSLSENISLVVDVRNNYTHNNTWSDLNNLNILSTETTYTTVETVLDDMNQTAFGNETVQDIFNNSKNSFDWMKSTGADEALLKMSHQDSATEVPPNYTIYIILGSMLAVLIVLTIVMFLIYKAYKARDHYTLTAGRGVRVRKSNLEEATSSKADEPDEFEVVDFDKNSYRF